MSPAYSAGDFVLVQRFFFTLREGDCVVVDHPSYGIIFKRITSIKSNSEAQNGIKYLLKSENDQGLSSDQIGWVERDFILGKVLIKFSR